MLSKSSGEEIARELISIFSVSFSIGSSDLLASMRDRASANNVAMQTLKIVYPSLVDVGCFSHTIDHAGERFECPTLDEFITHWIVCFHTAPSVKCFGGLELVRVCLATARQGGGAGGSHKTSHAFLWRRRTIST